MDTGVYRVQPSHCASCTTTIGWKFVRASERTEKWKEGYFVLELELLQEERAPLSPLEEVQIEAGTGYRSYRFTESLASADSVGAHRRTTSDSSTRQRPLGPRQRRSGSGSGSSSASGSDC